MKNKSFKVFFLVFLAACMSLAIANADAAVYYVSNSGNDANPGTQASPWRTIGKVNSTAFGPGDQILFQRGGVWREQLSVPTSGNAASPIVFGAYGSGNKPIISGANVIGSWTASGSNVYYATVYTQPNRVLFNGTPGTRKEGTGSLTSDRDWTWTSNNMLYVYSTTSPGARTIEAAQRDYGIIATSKHYLQFTNLEIQTGNRDNAFFYRGCTNVTIDNVTSSYGYQTGIKTYTDTSAVNSNFVIRNSTVTYNGGSGMALSTLANSLIKGNLITNNTMITGSDEQFYYAGGIRMTGIGSVNNIMEHNDVSYQRTGVGIWVDLSGTGNIVRFNRTHHNFQIGIFNEITSGTEIYGNVSHDNGGHSLSAGIWVEGRAGSYPYDGPATNNKVYNNTIYRNRSFGLVVQNGASGVQGNTHDNVFRNNIIFGTINGPNLRVGGRAEYEYNVFDRNCLGPDNTANFVEWGWGVYKSSYAAWESAYGRTTNSVKADPQLLNPGANDLSLKSTSPCVNTAVNLGDAYKFGLSPASQWPGGVATVDRNQHGTGWDVGGYEYTGGGGSATCTYSISPTSQTYAATTTSGTINVTAPEGCAWTAASAAPEVVITSGSSGTGNGTVVFTFPVNSGTSSRWTTITVAGQVFTLTQSGAASTAPTCSYSISAASQSIPASGGTGTVNVTSQTGCGWSASSGVSWVTITSGSAGTGSGSVSFSVAPNSSTTSRLGTMTIAGRTFGVSQAGSTATTTRYTINATAGHGGYISPSGTVYVSQGASSTFTVTARNGYRIAGVTVDGVSRGAISSFTFTNVNSNHTIRATFRRVRSW